MVEFDSRAPRTLRRRIVHLAQAGAYWSGMQACLPPRSGASILMYHSVSAPEAARFVDRAWRMTAGRFERQIRFLAEHRHVVPLDALVGALKVGSQLQPGTVVLTFDDGYRDNLEIAAPILRRYRVSATIFLATAYVGRGENQWVDRLYWSLTARTRHRLRLAGALLGGQALDVDLRDLVAVRQAYAAIGRSLLSAQYEAREPVLAALEEQLRPAVRQPRLTLNWDEVRRLRREYPEFEVGVHTARHVDLAAADERSVRAELSACIADVERETGVRPRHFSFPYGRFSPSACRAVADSGFDSAMGASGPWTVTARADRYRLPRLDALMSASQLRFRTHPSIAAVPAWLSARG